MSLDCFTTAIQNHSFGLFLSISGCFLELIAKIVINIFMYRLAVFSGIRNPDQRNIKILQSVIQSEASPSTAQA